MATKKCTKCGIVKSLKDFPTLFRSPDGYNTRCKECVSEYAKNYWASYSRNPRIKIIRKVNSKKYRKSIDPENRKKYSKAYYEKNKEKILSKAAITRSDKKGRTTIRAQRDELLEVLQMVLNIDNSTMTGTESSIFTKEQLDKIIAAIKKATE